MTAITSCSICGAGGSDPHGIERTATPHEVDNGHELGVAYDHCPNDPQPETLHVTIDGRKRTFVQHFDVDEIAGTATVKLFENGKLMHTRVEHVRPQKVWRRARSATGDRERAAQ